MDTRKDDVLLLIKECKRFFDGCGNMFQHVPVGVDELLLS